MNKYLIWGGVGVAALAGGFLLLRGGSPAPSQDNSGGGYYPATVYGTGGGSVASGDSGSSTDNSIASLIAGNLAIAQEQSSATKYTSDNLKQTQLATLDTQKIIALDDNKRAVQSALAGQLGAIVGNMIGGGTSGDKKKAGAGGSVAGSLGFDSSGKLNIGVTTGGGLANAPTLTELKTYVS